MCQRETTSKEDMFDNDDDGVDGDDDEVDTDLGNSETESTVSLASSNVREKKGQIRKEMRKSELSKNGKRLKQSSLLWKEFEVLDSVSKLLTQKLEKSQSCHDIVDSDELFGETFTSELRQFPEHLTLRVKHELDNVIYKYRLQCAPNQSRYYQESAEHSFSSPARYFEPSVRHEQISPAFYPNGSWTSNLNYET